MHVIKRLLYLQEEVSKLSEQVLLLKGRDRELRKKVRVFACVTASRSDHLKAVFSTSVTSRIALYKCGC